MALPILPLPTSKRLPLPAPSVVRRMRAESRRQCRLILVVRVRSSACRACQQSEDLLLYGAPTLMIALRQAVDSFHRFAIDLQPVAGVPLLTREDPKALLEIAADHSLHAAAIRADNLREKVPAHQGLTSVLLLSDHL